EIFQFGLRWLGFQRRDLGFERRRDLRQWHCQFSAADEVRLISWPRPQSRLVNVYGLHRQASQGANTRRAKSIGVLRGHLYVRDGDALKFLSEKWYRNADGNNKRSGVAGLLDP